MVKGFRQIVSLTMLSRIFGLARDLTCNYFFGASAISDAWWLAFKIPNLTRRIFGEGAASASFIPVYSEELKNDAENANRLASTVVTVIFTTLSLLVLLGWAGIGGYRLFTDVTADTGRMLSLTSVMLPYAIMICTVAILAGVLNSHFHFAAPAAAPVVLNICIIIGAFFCGSVLGFEPERQVFGIAVSVLFAGVIQLFMQFIPIRRLGVRIRPCWSIDSQAFRKIIIMMGPMILGLTVTQLNTLGDDVIAWCFSGSEDKGEFFTVLGKQVQYPLWRGSLTHLYFAQRFYQLPLGVFGISLATAIFPVLSKAAAEKDTDKLCKTVGMGIKCAFFVALPAMVGLMLTAKFIVAGFLEHGDSFSSDDTSKTAWTLIFYAVGLSGYFMQQVVTRAFYSLQDSKVPAKSAIIAVCVNLVLNLVLIWFLGTGGLALSTAICSYLQVVILFVVLRKRFEAGFLDGIIDQGTRVVGAAAVMAVSGYFLVSWLHSWAVSRLMIFVSIAICIIFCSGVYTVAAKILRIEMLSVVFGSKKK